MNANTISSAAKIFGFIVLCVVSFGCERDESSSRTTKRDQWSQLMDDVLKAGKSKDADSLVKGLSVYKSSDGKRLLKKIASANPSYETVVSDSFMDDQGYKAMNEDAKMFIRSYENLFTGEPVTITSRQYHSIKGVDLHMVALWVRIGEKLRGILIHRVWLDGDTLRVVEWVDTRNSASMSGVIWKSTAILEAPDIASCTIPDNLRYEQVFQ